MTLQRKEHESNGVGGALWGNLLGPSPSSGARRAPLHPPPTPGEGLVHLDLRLALPAALVLRPALHHLELQLALVLQFALADLGAQTGKPLAEGLGRQDLVE